MTLVRLEPAALWSRVKHSTTEPLRSQNMPKRWRFLSLCLQCILLGNLEPINYCLLTLILTRQSPDNLIIISGNGQQFQTSISHSLVYHLIFQEQRFQIIGEISQLSPLIISFQMDEVHEHMRFVFVFSYRGAAIAQICRFSPVSQTYMIHYTGLSHSDHD